MSAVLETVSDAPFRHFHLREIEWAESGNGQDYTFTGSAAVFNVWSEEIWTPRGSFRERILPGAFSALLASKPDVRFLQNHDKNRIMARTKSGTLELTEEADALRVWARVRRTSYATDLKIEMEAGNVDQMSLAFMCDPMMGGKERWYDDKRTGEVFHDVQVVSGLRDVSVVTFPAYLETEAAMRELERGIAVAIPGELSWVEPQLREGWAAVDPPVTAGGPLLTADVRAYKRTAEVVATTPWAILPSHLQLIMAILGERMSGYKPTEAEIQERIGTHRRSNEPVQRGGVAVIPLVGPIYSRAGAMQQVSASKSLDIFREQFRQAMNDPAVESILMDIDSPGGTSSGVPEMAAEIMAARKKKPVYAVANTMAASAAYWLGSAADKLFASPSADVGSVGVYAAHQDVSGQMEQKGVRTTLIHAGKYKVEGNMFEPLTPEAMAQIQEEVNSVYDDFVAAVAKQRGTTKADVLANYGEGRTVMARQAYELGMIDGVATFDEVLTQMSGGGLQVRGEDGGYEIIRASMDATFPPGEDFLYEIASRPKWSAALPPHSTETVDVPWDGPAQVAKVKAARTPLRQLHAWVDSGANPDQKGSYKFPHHMVADNGYPGAANVNGVRNALARLPGSSIPEADKPGVERHLRRHLDDFHRIHNVPGNAQGNVEDPVALRESLGLVAQAETDPAGDGHVASGQTGEPNNRVALRQASKDAMQRARDERIRLMKEATR